MCLKVTPHGFLTDIAEQKQLKTLIRMKRIAYKKGIFLFVYLNKFRLNYLSEINSSDNHFSFV